MKLTTSLKSSLSMCQKWAIGKGTLAACFYIKVPTGHKDLVAALRRVKEPTAQYFAEDGTLIARQWCFNRNQYLNLWNARGADPINYETKKPGRPHDASPNLSK